MQHSKEEVEMLTRWFPLETPVGKCKICGEEMVKHIVKEGARYHVHWYDGRGMHCSTRTCEDNHGLGKCMKGEIK